jgi:hypothetical protein
MKRRQVLWLALGISAALVLAVFLRSLVQTYIILPFTKFLWTLVILYHFFPQVDYWFLLIGVLVVITVASLSASRPGGKKKDGRDFHKWGNVERIAFWIERSKRSTYSKWHVARMLAETGLRILEYRERRRIPDRKLEGKDWDPPAPIQDYLQTALKTTYGDYSRRSSFFSRPKTPLDQDLEAVVEFLESKLEDGHEHPHP